MIGNLTQPRAAVGAVVLLLVAALAPTAVSAEAAGSETSALLQPRACPGEAALTQLEPVCFDDDGRPFLALPAPPHAGQQSELVADETEPCTDDLRPERRCALWSATYGHPAGAGGVMDTAQSPDGSTVYVTGYGWRESGQAPPGECQVGPVIVECPGSDPGDMDAVTAAFDVASGEQLWAATYDAGESRPAEAGMAVTVSPDGERVFVTGFRHGWVQLGEVSLETAEVLTLAYDAATGEHLWTATHNHAELPSSGGWGTALAVSPDGDLVYVTGTSRGQGTFMDAVVVAYHVEDGSEQWVTRHQGGQPLVDTGTAITVSPDGGRVFVAGMQNWNPFANPTEQLLLAIEARDPKKLGQVLWSRSEPGEYLLHVSVHPDGQRLHVAGYVGLRMAAAAYDAQSGDLDWVATRSGSSAHGIRNAAQSPNGERLYLVGVAAHLDKVVGLTMAVDTTAGATAWEALHPGDPYEDVRANAVAVTPDGSAVAVGGYTTRDPHHVTGMAACIGPPLNNCIEFPHGDFLTLWLNAGTGAEVWRARSNASPADVDRDQAWRVVTDGERVVVAGTRERQVSIDETRSDWHLLAYDAELPPGLDPPDPPPVPPVPPVPDPCKGIEPPPPGCDGIPNPGEPPPIPCPPQLPLPQICDLGQT